MRTDVAVVIPAYRPGSQLLDVLAGLQPAGYRVVVVNDGSGEDYDSIFAAAASMPGVEIVEHAVNLGKGAALRTGFNAAFARHRTVAGVVTADADGQHHPEDILKVAAVLAASPQTLVLGMRSFGEGTPLRSRVGNQLTRWLFRIVEGTDIRDTQTGLRGIPRRLAEAMLRNPATGYEFELEMLIQARQERIAIQEIEIQTLYFAGNASSHFRPVVDSVRIYDVLLRFAAASLTSSVFDNIVFSLLLPLAADPGSAQFLARIASAGLNFHLNRRLVFQFRGRERFLMLRFGMIVLLSGITSYAGLMSIHHLWGWPILTAKIAVESLLFFVNFVLMRDFVFIARKR